MKEEDKKSRVEAIDTARSFIVRAPAGSGKTSLLVKRYLNLLSQANTNRPEEIVVVTFTVKATAEIRDRVMELLYSAKNNKKSEDPFEKGLVGLAKGVLKNDLDKGWRLTECPDRLQIRTIDGFTYLLSRQIPFLGNPDIEMNLSSEYEAATTNTLFEHEESLSLFKDIILSWDNDLKKIKGELSKMLEKRDQWENKIEKCRLEEMQRDLANLIKHYLEMIVKKFPPQHKGDLVKLLQYAARNLVLEGKSEDPIALSISISEFPSGEIDNIIFFQAIKKMLLTKQGDWRKIVTKNNGFPPSGKKEKEQLAILIKNLKELTPSLPESLQKLDDFPSDTSLQTEWKYICAAKELLSKNFDKLDYRFKNQNITDHLGVSLEVNRELGNENSYRDLALNLDSKINHLLVDELQDVSPSQSKLIHILVSEWSDGDGRTIFLVGDPQQAIYGFRNAEVKFFNKIWRGKILGPVKLEQLKLHENKRSAKKIVDWFEKTFKAIFFELDEIEDAIEYLETYSEKKSEAALVQYHAYRGRDAEEREVGGAERIIKIIKERRKEAEAEKIAILVRSRFPLNSITPYLEKAEIPYRGTDILRISQMPEVKDLIALTRAFSFHADRIAWLSCLRAPWCGLKLESLLILCENGKKKTIWQCISDNELINRLDKDEKSRLERFRLTMGEAISRKQRAPLRDVIEALWYQLGGSAGLSEKQKYDYVSDYFSLLEEFDQGGIITDFQKFNERLESHCVTVSSGDGKNPIEIMTIHSAKGLEFDHVIIPALESRPISSSSLINYDSKQESTLIGVRPNVDTKGSTYHFLKQINKCKKRNEAKRLLYVSATRAKKTLHLITALSESKSGWKIQEGSFLSFLWPVCKMDFISSLPSTASSHTFEPPPQEINRLPSNWTLPEEVGSFCWTPAVMGDEKENNKLTEFKWAGETIKNVGSVVHRTIQQIAEDDIKNWTIERLKSEKQNFKKLLQEHRVPPDERGKALNYIFDALTNLLNDERGQWILSKEHNDQHNEYRVSGMVNDRLIRRVLDRTFLDKGGVRWIIDYKTSPHEGTDLDDFLNKQKEKYKPQLEEYAALMEGFGEKNVKLGLYFPLSKGWREWEYQKNSN